jgi:hypothetical protein
VGPPLLATGEIERLGAERWAREIARAPRTSTGERVELLP